MTNEEKECGKKILFFLIAIVFSLLMGMSIMAKIGRQETIDILNGDVMYDTLAIDKNGKILKIKIID